MHLGVGLWSGKGWIVMMLLPAMGIIWYGVVKPEERYLERKFPEAYLLYKRSVRRWL